MLLKSTDEDFKYHTVEIDTESGLFKKSVVDSKDTKIRVNNGIFGEQLTIGGSLPLTIDDITAVEAAFNSIRESKNWVPVEFRKTKEVKDEVSNTSEVQGQEEAETV